MGLILSYIGAGDKGPLDFATQGKPVAALKQREYNIPGGI